MSVCVLIVMLKSVLNPKKLSGAFRESVCVFVKRFIQLMYVTKYLNKV